MNSWKSRLISSVAMGVLLSADLAGAALAQDNSVDEIVVTARKREENLMSVPLAITALSAEALETRGLKTASDLAQFSPGFFKIETPSSNSARADRSLQSLIFRGLSLAGNSGLAAGGSVFLDGAPVLGLTTAGFADIERVEVLRGPQSVYFGRSTFGGAVNYVTRDPANRFQVKVSGEAATYGSNDESVSVEGPLIPDKLAARISLRHMFKGGQYKNFTNQDQVLGDESTKSIAVSVVAHPNESLKIKAYANYYVDDDGPPAEAAITSEKFNCVTATGRYLCGVLPDVPASQISAYNIHYPLIQSIIFDNVNNYSLAFNSKFLDHFGFKREAIQSHVIADYTNDAGYVLSSITAFHRDKWESIYDIQYRDYSYLPNPNFGKIPNTLPFYTSTNLGEQVTTDWSQELRLSSPQDRRLRWVVGANYLKVRQAQGSSYLLTITGPNPYSALRFVEVETIGVFGGAYFDITPKLTFSAEARYQQDKVDNFTPVIEAKFRSVSPRVTLDYKLDTDSTAYVLWSRGSRPGGFNSAFAQLTPAQKAEALGRTGGGVSYEEEVLDNYEVGLKRRFLDNRASLRAAGYFGILSNQQLSSTSGYTSPAGTNIAIPMTLNLGQTNIYGVELEGDFRATSKLNFSGTFDWARTDIRAYNCLNCLTYHSGTANVTGNRLTGVPEFTGTLSGNYADHLFGDYDWFARVDYIYRGTMYADLNNVAKSGVSNRINARIGLRRDSASLEAFVTNATNDETSLGGVNASDPITGRPEMFRVGLPVKRVFGVRAAYTY